LVKDSRPPIEFERQIQAETSEFTFEWLISGDEFLAVPWPGGPVQHHRPVPASHRIRRRIERGCPSSLFHPVTNGSFAVAGDALFAVKEAKCFRKRRLDLSSRRR
jgi:hypothetical protein